MKANTLLTILILGFVSVSSAHFVAGHLLIDGESTGLWKHVLEVAKGGPDITAFGKMMPQYFADSVTTNITCGRLAFDSIDKTEIADVVAGETKLGFRNANLKELMPTGDGYDIFFHAGPGQVWLSKAPNDDLKSYRGNGDWFKVAYAGPQNNTWWKLFRTTEYQSFVLPKTTPPGKYLMRWEYLYPSDFYDAAQFFINCALINVIGEGGGTPTQFSKFPGSYSRDDVGLRIPPNQYWGGDVPDDQLRILEYKAPGGPVWTG